MKQFLSFALSLLFVVACSTSNPQTMNQDTVAPPSSMKNESVSYKKSFYAGEIPATWSHVVKGDIAFMSYTENMWIENQNILYSFAPHYVSYGDVNWSQVDFALMDSKDMIRSVAFFKKLDRIDHSVKEWTQETIDGRTADVATFNTEADGTISKGATGGKMYFIPNAEHGMGVIIAKQARGDEEFESGFRHYIETIDFDAQ